MLEGESGVGTSGEGSTDIRDKIIGAFQGMREGLPQLDERLAELERYVEEEHLEAKCKKRVAEVLTDISSFTSPLSALVRVVEGSLEMCGHRAVKLKERAREECKPIHILIKDGRKGGKDAHHYECPVLDCPTICGSQTGCSAHINAHLDIMYGPCSEGCKFRTYNRDQFDRHHKNVSITNQQNYLLIFGGYLNCRYWGEVKNLCLYKML